jgi:Flp pilus assembly protein TadD
MMGSKRRKDHFERDNWHRLIGLVGLSVVLLVLTGCNDTPPPPKIRMKTQDQTGPALVRIERSPVTPPTTGYVGAQACVACHAEICESYSRTAMGRSTARAKEAPVIENYSQDWVVASHGFRYRAEQKDGQTIHHEQLVDADGNVLAQQSEKIDWEMGSGTRGRSYLIQRGDQLVMSPLTWYTMGGRFDISPGYAGSNRHFERPVGEGCSQCHVGQMALVDDHRPDRFGDPAFPVPQIDCERCHGPAEDHVRFQELRKSGQPLAGLKDLIVNPESLDVPKRDSVCYQCHLLGVERVLRPGRSEGDFRPGQSLSDVWAIFHKDYDGVAEDKTTDAVNQVSQMESSQCFLKSDGKFSCISCHDPHETIPAEKRDLFYRDKCLACHQSADRDCALPEPARRTRSASDSCIQCHMPALPSRDVQHTSQTDHRIRRDPNHTETRPRPDSYQLYHGMEQLPQWEKDRARGLLVIRTAVDQVNSVLAQQAIDILSPLDRAGANDAEIKNALGDAYMLQRHIDVAVDYWKAALQVDPQYSPALRSLAIDNHDRGFDEVAEQQMREYLKSQAEDRIVLGRHIHALGRLGRLDEACSRAEVAVQKFPMDLQLRSWLANYYTTTGRDALAVPHRKVAERLQTRQATGSGSP